MKPLRLIVLLFLMLSLLPVVAACGGEDEPPAVVEVESTAAVAPQPTDTPLPQPTDTPIPPTVEEESGEGLTGELPQLGTPDSLISFRSKMVITWTGTMTDGTETSGAMAMMVEYVREPAAQHVAVTGDTATMAGMGVSEGESLEMYIVDNTTYASFMGSWLQMPAGEGGIDAEEIAFDSASGMLEGMENAKYEGKTTYNGVEVKHYSFDKESFSEEMLSSGMDIDEGSGNLYLAVDGDYLVHMDTLMKGTNIEVPSVETKLENGSIEFTIDLTDINAPISIVVPQEALDSGKPPEDIPIPDNAEELQVIAMMGTITFKSPVTPSEVADYYKAEMPKNGWSEDSAEEIGGLYMVEFSKPDRTASLMITTDDAGKTTVMITIPTEE